MYGYTTFFIFKRPFPSPPSLYSLPLLYTLILCRIINPSSSFLLYMPFSYSLRLFPSFTPSVCSLLFSLRLLPSFTPPVYSLLLLPPFTPSVYFLLLLPPFTPSVLLPPFIPSFILSFYYYSLLILHRVSPFIYSLPLLPIPSLSPIFSLPKSSSMICI